MMPALHGKNESHCVYKVVEDGYGVQCVVLCLSYMNSVTLVLGLFGVNSRVFFSICFASYSFYDFITLLFGLLCICEYFSICVWSYICSNI